MITRILSRKGAKSNTFTCLLCDCTSHSDWVLSYFEKIAHMSVVWLYVSLWLCRFVALYVRMFVAGANKVEGTMS